MGNGIWSHLETSKAIPPRSSNQINVSHIPPLVTKIVLSSWAVFELKNITTLYTTSWLPPPHWFYRLPDHQPNNKNVRIPVRGYLYVFAY